MLAAVVLLAGVVLILAGDCAAGTRGVGLVRRELALESGGPGRRARSATVATSRSGGSSSRESIRGDLSIREDAPLGVW